MKVAGIDAALPERARGTQGGRGREEAIKGEVETVKREERGS